MTPGNNVIEVVLKLIDDVTKPLNKIQGDISKSLGSIKGLIGIAIGGWSFSKLIANVTEAESVTMRLDQTFANLGKTVGVTRERMDELASELQQTTTYSDDAVKSAEALLMTFTKVRGEAFERTIKVAADMAAALGGELEASVQRLGRSLQNPTYGMMLLRRSGIELTTTQREQIKTMIAAGDTFGAQTAILDALEKRYAGMAAAMRNTLGGAFTALQNQIGELLEGDSGSFKGAVEAINELTKTLEDPRLKNAGDQVVTLFVNIAGGAAQAAAAVLNFAEVYGEAWARVLHGSDQPLQRFEDNIRVNVAQQEVLKESIRGLNQLLADGDPKGDAVYAQRLKATQVALTALQKQEQELRRGRTQLLKEIQASGQLTGLETPKPKKPVADPVAAAIGPERDLETMVARAIKLRKGLQTELEKTQEMVAAEMANIAALMHQERIDPGSTGFSLGELDAMANDLRAELSKAVGGAAKEANEAWKAQFLKDFPEIAITARKVGDGAAEALIAGWNAQTQTAFERDLAAWREHLAVIEELAKLGPQAGGISPEEAARRRAAARDMVGAVGAVEQALAATDDELASTVRAVKELQESLALLYQLPKEALIELGYTPEQLDQAVAGLDKIIAKAQESSAEANEFAVQAARTIQSTLADAFMSIGKGLDGVVDSFANAFKRILAEAAAMDLAKALGLDTLLKGKPGESALGGLLERWLPSKRRGGEAAVGEAASAATAQASEVAKGCGGEVAKAVGKETALTVGGELKAFGSGIMKWLDKLLGGLWKFITTTLRQIMDMIRAAVAAFQAARAGGGGIFESIGAGIGSLFGAAGGGQIPGNRPTVVGEEGPEVITPSSPMQVYNQRQLAALGGMTLNFAPQYAIALTGVRDDDGMMAQLGLLMARRDEQNKKEMLEMLRRNGFGRMRR